MTSPILTIETAAGTVCATAGPRQDGAVIVQLSGAVRGSVHVTGTHHPHHWDQFTAVRACLGPVNAFQTTAPDDALPRLARSRTGYRGSLTLYRDDIGHPQVTMCPAESTAGHPPSEKANATLTAVLRACAEHVAQREDLPELLDGARGHDTPALLRFLTYSAKMGRATAARLDGEADAATPARRAAVAGWWTVARWLTASPHPVLLIMLAPFPGSLSRTITVMEWKAPYCRSEAARERERARNAEAEAESLRAQRARRRAPRPSAGASYPVSRKAGLR